MPHGRTPGPRLPSPAPPVFPPAPSSALSLPPAIYPNRMEQPSFDPGLTQKFDAPLLRFINKDGSFNVHREGLTWRDVHPYLYLINMSWPGFLGIVVLAYI